METPPEISYRKQRRYKRKVGWHIYKSVLKHYIRFKEFDVETHNYATVKGTYCDEQKGEELINPRTKLIHIGCSCGWYVHGNDELFEFWKNSVAGSTAEMTTPESEDWPDDYHEDEKVDKNSEEE